MSMILRRIAIRMVLPLSWRPSRTRIAERLMYFSAIEADSAWQFLQALDAVNDAAQRASLFNNALEEVHHASLFERAAREYGDGFISQPVLERKAVYDPGKGLHRFLAYVYVGEGDVFGQFSAYSAAIGPGPARETFDLAMADEAGHASLAMELLVKRFGDPAETRRHIRIVRLTRTWEAWLRFSKALGERSAGILLALVYFLAGPVYSAKSRRMVGR